MIPKYKPASHLSDNESEKSYNSEEERKNYERLHTYREKRKYKTGFVDNFQSFFNYEKTTAKSLDTLLLPDGIHPNDTGHEMMANSIVKEIIHMYHNRL